MIVSIEQIADYAQNMYKMDRKIPWISYNTFGIFPTRHGNDHHVITTYGRIIIQVIYGNFTSTIFTDIDISLLT